MQHCWGGRLLFYNCFVGVTGNLLKTSPHLCDDIKTENFHSPRNGFYVFTKLLEYISVNVHKAWAESSNVRLISTMLDVVSGNRNRFIVLVKTYMSPPCHKTNVANLFHFTANFCNNEFSHVGCWKKEVIWRIIDAKFSVTLSF